MSKGLLIAALAMTGFTVAHAADVGSKIDVTADAAIGQPYAANKTYISDETYEVTVEGKRGDSLDEVMDKALYKAAKKTLGKDYEWFRVIERETEKDTTETRTRGSVSGGFEAVPERRCGLLGCMTTTRTYYRGGIRSDFPDRKDTEYTVTLEYEMGAGYVEDSRNVYDARIVKNSYRD